MSSLPILQTSNRKNFNPTLRSEAGEEEEGPPATKEEEEIQEVTVIPMATTEISMNDAIVTLLSELEDILTLKTSQWKKDVVSFLHILWQEGHS